MRVVWEAAAVAGLFAAKLVEQEEGIEISQLWPPDRPVHPLAAALRLADARPVARLGDGRARRVDADDRRAAALERIPSALQP